MPVSSNENRSLSFAAFVQILLQGRRTILIASLAALVLATVIAFVTPLSYTATTSFVPPGSTGSASNATAVLGQLSALGGGNMLGGKGQGDLYAGILKSHTISRELVQRFNLMTVYKVKKISQAEKVLSRNSLFEVNTKDPIVTINVTDKSPERARDLANGYLQALQTASADLALTESSQRRLFYERRLSKEKDELAEAEVALKQAQEKTGLIAPTGQTISKIQMLAELQAQITDRQVQLSALLQSETDQNPDVVRLRSEIAKLQAQVGQLENGQKDERFGRFSAAQVPELQLEYIRKAREVKYHEALFGIIAKQYETARLDEAKDSPLQVLDHAIVPDSKSGPHRSIIMAIGLLAGILCGSAWVLAQAARHQSP
jgi:uncharacterized protein involved in exopolysaccharide biosynthesis